MKHLILLSASLTLTACGSVPTSNYLPESTKVDFPPKNVVTQVELGEKMLAQGVISNVETLVVSSPQEIMAYEIYPGSFDKVSFDDEFSYYAPSPNDGGGKVTRGVLVETFDYSVRLRVENGKNEVCMVSPIDMTVCDDIEYELESQERLTKNSYQQTLIYNGRTGESISIGYREFSGNIARPAFSNEVTYDLGESNVIGYKGARIEVMQADNTTIKYKVLEGFQ